MFVENRDNTLNDLVLTENVGREGYKILSNIIKKQAFINTHEWNEKIQLERYFKNMSPDGIIKVKYIRKHPFGRCNAEYALGLHMMRRAVRHTLCSDLYEDIDMVCCHQSILLNICNNLNLRCPILEKYVNDRDSILKQVMDFYKVNKSSAKTLFISMTNGGTLKKWFDDNSVASDLQSYLQIVKSYKTEMNRLAKILIDKSPEIYDFVKTIKEKNINGSFMSYYLQEIECRILEQVYLYCVEKGYIVNNNVILTSDGIMLEKQYYNDNMLKEFTNLIINKFNFKIDFVNKSMDEILNIEITPELDEKNELPLYDEEFTTGLLSDYFEEKYDTWTCVFGKAYYFRDFRWYEDNEDFSLLFNFLDSIFIKDLFELSAAYRSKILSSSNYEININKINLFDKNINKIRNIGFRKGLVKDILNKIRNDKIEFDSDPYIFCFENCFYDIQKKKFSKQCSPDLYLKTTCGYEYDFNYKSEKIDELQQLLNTIFNENVKKYYVSILKTGLIGKLYEHLFICTGRGGNGKSLLNSLMLKTVGNYGYVLPSEFLLKNIPTGANPQVANIHKKRFVLSSEPDREKSITASTIKDLTGNTELNARGLYSSNCKVVNNITLVLEANDLPKMSEVNEAIDRRIRIVPFCNLFISGDKFLKLDEDTKKTGVFQANTFYKTEEFQNEYKQALFEILRYSLESDGERIIEIPDECQEFNKSYLQDSDYIYQFLTENYKCVEDSKEFIYINDIYELFVDSSYYKNLSRDQRKGMNKKNFVETMRNNLFLRKFFKGKDKGFNKVVFKKPALIHWFRKNRED